MRWLVAYNYPTGTWCSGGNQEDYVRPLWDVYEVFAKYRDDAETEARVLRRQHRALPARQKTMLAQLIELAHGSVENEVDVSGMDMPTLIRLEGKRLVRLLRDGAGARLTLSAFNQGLVP